MTTGIIQLIISIDGGIHMMIVNTKTTCTIVNQIQLLLLALMARYT